MRRIRKLPRSLEWSLIAVAVAIGICRGIELRVADRIGRMELLRLRASSGIWLMVEASARSACTARVASTSTSTAPTARAVAPAAGAGEVSGSHRRSRRWGRVVAHRTDLPLLAPRRRLRAPEIRKGVFFVNLLERSEVETLRSRCWTLKVEESDGSKTSHLKIGPR